MRGPWSRKWKRVGKEEWAGPWRVLGCRVHPFQRAHDRQIRGEQLNMRAIVPEAVSRSGLAPGAATHLRGEGSRRTRNRSVPTWRHPHPVPAGYGRRESCRSTLADRAVSNQKQNCPRRERMGRPSRAASVPGRSRTDRTRRTSFAPLPHCNTGRVRIRRGRCRRPDRARAAHDLSSTPGGPCRRVVRKAVRIFRNPARYPVAAGLASTAPVRGKTRIATSITAANPARARNIAPNPKRLCSTPIIGAAAAATPSASTNLTA